MFMFGVRRVYLRRCVRGTEEYTSKLKININYPDWMVVSRRSWPNNKLRGKTSIRDRAARIWIESKWNSIDHCQRTPQPTQNNTQLKCCRNARRCVSVRLVVFSCLGLRCRWWFQFLNGLNWNLKSETFQVQLVAETYILWQRTNEQTSTFIFSIFL